MGNDVGAAMQRCNGSRQEGLCQSTRRAYLFNSQAGAIFGQPLSKFGAGHPPFVRPTLAYIAERRPAGYVSPEEMDGAQQLADCIRTMLDDRETVDVVRCLQDSDDRQPGSGWLPGVALVASWLYMLPEPLIDEGARAAWARVLSSEAPGAAAAKLMPVVCQPGSALALLLRCIADTRRNHGEEASAALALIWAPVLFGREAAVKLLLQLPSLVRLVEFLAAHSEAASPEAAEPSGGADSAADQPVLTEKVTMEYAQSGAAPTDENQ